MWKIILSEVAFLFLLFSDSLAMPPNGNCPVPTTDEEFGTSKVLNLNKIKGHKVRVQFFYPSEQSVLRALENTTIVPEALEKGEALNVTLPEEEGDAFVKQNVFCQWTFKAGEDSDLMLLTFEKLSAPYSENCQDAFVALQKDGGYESRWCGNRAQANSRPMTILVRADAMVTVYRSKSAALLPPTGFKLSVKKLEVGSISPQLPERKPDSE